MGASSGYKEKGSGLLGIGNREEINLPELLAAITRKYDDMNKSNTVREVGQKVDD